MALKEFEQLLKQAIGLDAASVGSSAIERAVQRRMAACQSESLSEYREFVRASESERQELIEAVVVPETWFFRDGEAFTALGRIVQMERPANDALVRVLSVPSSTGEEAYSIAMTLFDAGLAANHFGVEAFDVSRYAVAQAERAVYGRNSFRGQELQFRDRYFEATEQGYRLSERVRRQVRFRQGNLFGPQFLSAVESYDIVFCRNLLIY
ncbi:MAG TPA: CheR family methyltransferase, partial [Candidatus Binatia bacterium]|nr:CheR family methyltransferase [Candidatus Binatia bacterium]